MCQGRNAIQTNKTELKILVMYEGMKKTPNFQKVHFGASKRQKQQLGTPVQMCFLSLTNF